MKTQVTPQSGKATHRLNRGSGARRERPLRALFMLLNQPQPSAYGRQRITEHAAKSVRVIQLGLGAIGQLLAHSAVQVEEQSIPAECVESLGVLMAELGELAALCHQLSTEGPSTATVFHEGGAE